MLRRGSRFRGGLVGALLIGLTIAEPVAGAQPDEAVPPLASETQDGFAVPQPGTELVFPRDHGSHPRFRVEWWYLTGHLFDDAGRRFGFQATFFRSARHPPKNSPGDPAAPDSDSASVSFGRTAIFLAHMSVLDVTRRRFRHEERLNRDGWDAHATVGHLDVANGNWSLRMTDPENEIMHLSGSVRAEAVFDLLLRREKPRVVFGREGVSRKGADPVAASHYITFPRLAVSGRLRLAGETLAVSGLAWMDHEYGSSQLSTGQTGWDWCCVQLRDGWDLMAYRLRRADGSKDPFSTLAWIAPDGRLEQLPANGFSWEPLGFWTSDETGARYPIRYRLLTRSPVTGETIALEFDPLLEQQEITGRIGGIAYWEGAGDVHDGEGRIVGRGYTELTGYAKSLFGQF